MVMPWSGHAMPYIDIGAGGLGFAPWAGQIGHSTQYRQGLVTALFSLNFEAVLPERSAAETGPVTHYTLRRNTASIMKT